MNPRPGPMVLAVVGVMVVASAVVSALIIGPLHTAMRLPPLMAWLTWAIPASMQVAIGLCAYERAGTWDLGMYRATRQGFHHVAVILAVLAVCAVSERPGGFDPAAAAVAVVLCATGPVLLAGIFFPRRHLA
ncbi:hypothetical protein D7D52_35995 [Nocardia yunnanensis]|uniref:Uncharacterized protein n=1 Tax=Nocardia yunnanensis TaxID=2382165 RepID=A0A386ZKF3_9NOCA|nr:hypothetical protein [Nocardia yunnanensis]AYF78342.1 hypothetical protein D7D52_35995 [Nocardia yunnanensis]